MYKRAEVMPTAFQITRHVGGEHYAAVRRTRPNGISFTHPRRGGTELDALDLCPILISIHPPRAGWDICPRFRHRHRHISIHPPRAGWDFEYPSCSIRTWISIHPPRAGWDGRRRSALPWGKRRFQSTHPVRGGTPPPTSTASCWPNFNPPTPCGVGPPPTSTASCWPNFNPPTPCGVGRRTVHRQQCDLSISIHPPRAGWDLRDGPYFWRTRYFNPPTPCGVGRGWKLQRI